MIPDLLCGDSAKVLSQFPDQEFQCCVTSPPYFGLRDYNTDNQIGREPIPSLYVESLCVVLDQVHRVLKSDGTLWLNIGDSYSSGGRKVRDLTSSNKNNVGSVQLFRPQDGMKPKELIGIPWMVAFALRSRGWYLRSDIVWHKPAPMPESVKDRPTRAHEYVFLLAKSESYFYDYKAILEPFADSRMGRDGGKGKSTRNVGGRTDGLTKPNNIDPSKNGGRNSRDVWTISAQPYKEAHFAVFPEKLVEPCVLAGSRLGDIVLDPFMGSGTVGVVCRRLGREFTGIDVNPEYVKLAEKRIG